jgi:F-type H+-transporting ATPase subunit epsilon
MIAPDHAVFSGMAELVEIPGVEGDVGVLSGHSPFFSMIRPGVITIHQPGEQKLHYFVSAGYADVSPEGTTILSSDVLTLAEVTPDYAATQKQAALDAVNLAETETERTDAAKKLERADALLAVAKVA